MLKNLILIFVGGGAGSVLRYALGRWLNTGNVLPWGTLTANLLGSFLIGLVLAYAGKHENQWMVFLFAVGFCGGFTTFSGFAFENWQFITTKAIFSFLTYGLLTFISCIFAVFCGILTYRYFTA